MKTKAKNYEQKASKGGKIFLSIHAPEAVGRVVLDYMRRRNVADPVHKTTVRSLMCDAVLEYVQRHPIE